MDVCAAFVANEQSFHPVKPGEGALDDPAVAAQAGAVLGLAAREERFDPELEELPAVRDGVVAAIRDQPVGPSARATDEAGDRGNTVEQR